MLHVKPWSQPGTHSKGPESAGYYDGDRQHRCHQFPRSYGQRHLAFASCCDGTESELPTEARSQVQSRASPVSPVTLQAQGQVVTHKEKGTDKGSHKAMTQSWSPSIDNYKSPVVFLKKGKQDTHWKRAWGPLRA